MAFVIFGNAFFATTEATEIKHVIHVSVDGLRGDAIRILGSLRAPHFYRFRREGAFTDNARTDARFANTLPNHASQFTGRKVLGLDGHGLTVNKDKGQTLQEIKGQYIASMFDVAHDNGLSTALFVGKNKFAVFERSWNSEHGGKDKTGEDNGRDKIDRYLFEPNTAALFETFMREMKLHQFALITLHIRDPDAIGHEYQWDISPNSKYMKTVVWVDSLLGKLFNLIQSTAGLKNKTAIILTSDHGGINGDIIHGIFPTNTESTIIPFYVWGPDVAPSQDLYDLNPKTAAIPGELHASNNEEKVQPIRNGDVANLALRLLGLGPVPGSTITALKNLSAPAQ